MAGRRKFIYQGDPWPNPRGFGRGPFFYLSTKIISSVASSRSGYAPDCCSKMHKHLGANFLKKFRRTTQCTGLLHTNIAITLPNIKLLHYKIGELKTQRDLLHIKALFHWDVPCNNTEWHKRFLLRCSKFKQGMYNNISTLQFSDHLDFCASYL